MHIGDKKITPADFMGSHEAVPIAKTRRGGRTRLMVRHLLRLAVRFYSWLASHGADIQAAHRTNYKSGYPYI